MVPVVAGVRGGKTWTKPGVHLWLLQPTGNFSLSSVTLQILETLVISLSLGVGGSFWSP